MKAMYCCDIFRQHFEADELGLTFSSQRGEFGLKYRDGGSAYQTITFCPWCGQRLKEGSTVLVGSGDKDRPA